MLTTCTVATVHVANILLWTRFCEVFVDEMTGLQLMMNAYYMYRS